VRHNPGRQLQDVCTAGSGCGDGGGAVVVVGVVSLAETHRLGFRPCCSGGAAGWSNQAVVNCQLGAAGDP
jgi:hypothetical protein